MDTTLFILEFEISHFLGWLNIWKLQQMIYNEC